MMHDDIVLVQNMAMIRNWTNSQAQPQAKAKTKPTCTRQALQGNNNFVSTYIKYQCFDSMHGVAALAAKLYPLQ